MKLDEKITEAAELTGWQRQGRFLTRGALAVTLPQGRREKVRVYRGSALVWLLNASDVPGYLKGSGHVA